MDDELTAQGDAPHEELVDLVDERDRVIGVVAKLATDRDPCLIRREVAILLHDGDSLLWQLRAAAREVMPLTWDVACAGHVRAGEDPLAAAHRELREELRIDVALTPLERRLWRIETESVFAHVFAGSVDAALPIDPDPAEVAALEWCDRARFARWRAQGRALNPIACELAEDFWRRRGASRAG